MCALALSVVSAACTLPRARGDGSNEDDVGPSVSDVTPREGDYGTSIAVVGERLSGATVTARSPDGEVVEIVAAKTSKSSSKGASSADSTPGPLTFRFPFPAEGEMTLTASGESVSLGAFVPATSPGRPAPFPAGSRVFGASVLGDTTVAFVETDGRVGFLTFGSEEPRFVAVEPALERIETSAIRADGGQLEAVVRADQDVLRIVFDGNVAKATKFDLTSAGTLLGAGIDEKGIVVVVQTNEGIVRMRGEAPNLAAHGPAVEVPTPKSKYKATAVSGDGSVVIAWSGSGGSLIDETASFSMRGLPSTATAWGPGMHLATLDDTASSLTASVEAGVVHLNYCAVDTGFFESTKTHCSATLTLDGNSKLSAPSSPGALAIEPGRVGYTRCDADGYLVVGAVGEAPREEVRALYPCGRVLPTVASVERSRVVVQTDAKLWAPRPRR